MWEHGLPQADEKLRQGDLLRDVPFPVFRTEPQVDGSSRDSVKFTLRPAVVVSQCCTTQQRDIAELAAVVRTRPLPDDHKMVQGLLLDWPAQRGKLFFDGMLLDPIGDVVLDQRHEGRWWHIAFRTRATYTDDLAWLQHKRVARMTVVARRNLRMRLGAWYSRVEADDRAALERDDEFTGFGDLTNVDNL